MMLAEYMQRNLKHGIAAAIRITTTFHPAATQSQMVAAGATLGLSASTVRIQFNQARREDADIERLCA